MRKVIIFFLAIFAVACCTSCSIFTTTKKPYSAPVEYGSLYNYYEIRYLSVVDILSYTSYSNFANNKVQSIEYEDYILQADTVGGIYQRWRSTTRVGFDEQHVPITFFEKDAISKAIWRIRRQQYYQNIVDEDGFLTERKWYNVEDSSYAFTVEYSYNSDGQISKVKYKGIPNGIALYFSYDDSLRMTEMEFHEGITREYYKINELGIWYEQSIAKTNWLGLCTSDPVLRIRKEFEAGRLRNSTHYYRVPEYDGLLAVAGADTKEVYEYNEQGLMIKILDGTNIHPSRRQDREERNDIRTIIEYNGRNLPVRIMTIDVYGNPIYETQIRYEYYK